MKFHLKWIVSVVIVLVCIIALFFVYYHPNTSSLNSESSPVAKTSTDSFANGKVTLNNLQKALYKVNVPSKANVFMIKNNEIQLINDDELIVKQGTFTDKVDNDTRFILVPDDINLTIQEKTQLQKWVNEEKVVLFFGTNVQPNKVFSILNVNQTPISPQTDAATLYYKAYGYGYSYQYRADIPIFMMTNLKDASLTSYLHEFLYENRGF